MKRVFVIEYPGELGEMWLNEDNLLIALKHYCRGIDFVIDDVTDEIDTVIRVAIVLSNCMEA